MLAPDSPVNGSETSPFGRGWTTAGVTLVCMLMLTLARAYGAGPYGFAGVPFLLGLFVSSGVIAGRAVGALVGRVSSTGAWLLGVPSALATLAASGAVWNGTPSDRPLLVRLFAISAAVSGAWALGSSQRARRGAWATLGIAVLFLVIAIAVD